MQQGFYKLINSLEPEASCQGLRHATDSTSTPLGGEAATCAHLLVDRHAGDLHLEPSHSGPADAVTMGVGSEAVASGGALLADWWTGSRHVEVQHEVALGALTGQVHHVLGWLREWWEWQRGEDPGPRETSVHVLRRLLVGTGHKVGRHEWALLCCLVALAIRGLTLRAVEGASLH